MGASKRVLVLLALLALLLGSLAQAREILYVASKLRQPFHVPTCQWALKIAPENLQTFETRDQAIRAGHRPCKVCDP